MDITNLYNLIINSQNEEKTFDDNIELWQDFYRNRVIIIQKNITDKRLYTIIKFLLKNEQNKIFIYFQSNLLDTLLDEEEMVSFNLRNNRINDNNPIETLWTNLEKHEDIVSFLDTIPKTDDPITNNSINLYKRSNIKQDVTEALIMVMHKDFFSMPPQLVHKICEFVDKEMQSLTKKQGKTTLLDINFIFQYIERFLPIKRYIGKDINDSNIIKDILNGNIQDKKIISKFLNTLKDKEFLNVFDYNIINFINFLDKQTNIDEVYKQSIMHQITDRFFNEEYFNIFFPAYIENINNKYLNNCIDKKKFLQLITYANSNSPVFLSFETINYLLDNNYTTSLFISNLNELVISNKSFLTDEETITIKDKIKDKITQKQEYTFDQAINMIDSYLKEEIELTAEQMNLIIKSIIKTVNKNLGLEEINVFFVKNNGYNGLFYQNDEAQGIDINIKLIQSFLKKNISLSDRIQVFITLLHEIRHHEQYQKKSYEIDSYKMQKENYLEKYDPNYYSFNYKIVNEEMDARVGSYDMVAKFLETYLPNHLDKVQNSIISKLNHELKIKKEQNEKNEIQVIKKNNINFNQAFDLLIRYNPEIIKNNPIFNLEYYPDGTIKSYDDILINQTNQNKDLITEILKNKYPEIYSLSQKEQHIK